MIGTRLYASLPNALSSLFHPTIVWVFLDDCSFNTISMGRPGRTIASLYHCDPRSIPTTNPCAQCTNTKRPRRASHRRECGMIVVWRCECTCVRRSESLRSTSRNRFLQRTFRNNEKFSKYSSPSNSFPFWVPGSAESQPSKVYSTMKCTLTLSCSKVPNILKCTCATDCYNVFFARNYFRHQKFEFENSPAWSCASPAQLW